MIEAGRSRALTALHRTVRRWSVMTAAVIILAGCVEAGVGTQIPSVSPPPAPSAAVAASVPAPTAVPVALDSPSNTPTGAAATSSADCVNLALDYIEGTRGTKGNPVGLARNAVSGIRTSDVVERGEPIRAGVTVRIVRGSEVIGHVTYLADNHGGWLLSGGSLCGGLGFKS
jgi:hypothetical protein